MKNSLAERRKLAQQLLQQVKEGLLLDNFEDLMFQSFIDTERLVPGDSEIFYLEALILYLYGELHQKKQFVHLAFTKIVDAQAVNPLFFETYSAGWHLWGNILVALRSDSFLEEAMSKFERAVQLTQDETEIREIYWDWGEAWILLGRESQELSDFQQGVAKFVEAGRLGCDLPQFRLEYGEALVELGKLLGDWRVVERAMTLFRKVIADTYHPKNKYIRVNARGWSSYAAAAKYRFELTHKQEHFESADSILLEAVTAVPQCRELWLSWGELYLRSGWLNCSLKEIEMALEKLTSSAAKQCDPLSLSALLGEGLLMLGHFLEDVKPLNEGRKRILAALEIAPEHPELNLAAGLAYLIYALYFSDVEYYSEALYYFEKGLEKDATSLDNWLGLYRTYLEWGKLQKEPTFIQKAIHAIKRMSDLRPFSAIYLNEWGEALLCLIEVEKGEERHQALLEEATQLFKKAFGLSEEGNSLFNWGCALDLLGDFTGDEEDYEQAIEILTKVYNLLPCAKNVRYHLALALSHLGELTENIENLYKAVELFELIAKGNPSDENIWSDFGYTLLNLSEHLFDPMHPFQGEELRREAEKKLIHAAELGSENAYYHLSCLYSLSGLHELSIHYLKRAESVGALPSIEDLEYDDWLAKVRATKAFQEFLTLRKEEQ